MSASATKVTARRPQVPYWTTTPLSREQLDGAMRLAEQQDEAVMAIFRHYQRAMAPSEVHAIGEAGGWAWLLTSVRRSMTNLADPQCGALVRLDATKQGPWGRPEHCWALPVEQGRVAA